MLARRPSSADQGTNTDPEVLHPGVFKLSNVAGTRTRVGYAGRNVVWSLRVTRGVRMRSMIAMTSGAPMIQRGSA